MKISAKLEQQVDSTTAKGSINQVANRSVSLFNDMFGSLPGKHSYPAWRGAIRRLLLGLMLVAAFHPAVAEPVPAIGLNKFDLVQQYLGTASGGDGSAAYRKVTQAMARKAIKDAGYIGAPFVRVSATGYRPVKTKSGKPGDLDLWREDPVAYWRLFDQMMSDLQASNVKLVPVFVWNMRQFPAMSGGTLTDLLTDPESASYRLLRKYVLEFVERYRNQPSLYFYELTNELNLGVDLDLVGRCRKKFPAEVCALEGNYTTAEMVAFTSRLASLIRQHDPSHLISSGFSVPRPGAEALRRAPEWLSSSSLGKKDTPEEFAKNLNDIHQGVDIVSVHLYDMEANRRFGATDATVLLDLVKKAADRAGKPLYMGEFGGPDPVSAVPGSFTDKILDKLVAQRVPYSSVWIWEFYQRAPYSTRNTKDDAFSLEPGVTDGLIKKLEISNEKLGIHPPVVPEIDKTPPQVVLTWPLECALVGNSQQVCAVASDNSGKLARVEFWLGGKRSSTVINYPYCFTLDVDDLTAGEVPLVARAVDAAGNTAEFATTLVIKARTTKDSVCGASNR